MTARLSVLLWTTVLFLFLGSHGAVAQSGRGTIRGLVTDATGSALQQVSVTASNVETGIVTTRPIE